jgi:hypothetical protein
LGEKVIFGLNLVEEAEATVRHIKDNLNAAKSRLRDLCKQDALTFRI